MSVKTINELKGEIKISLEILAGFIEDAFEDLKRDDLDCLDIALDNILIESKKVRRTLDNIFDEEYDD